MKTIVITSIFPPTTAVAHFAALCGYRLIVVGDRKTPPDWSCNGAQFISLDAQNKTHWSLAKVMPENHYCRKMLGYLEAIALGSTVIIDTDDDNIPHPHWSFPIFDAVYDTVSEWQGFVNMYQLFTDQPIWPRGLPLQLITTQFELEKRISRKASRVGIWQGLADDDPDVDAIYRLTCDVPCRFRQREPVVLAQGVVCPFNSQNTAFRSELFPLLYLPTDVTFRFTDILRGIVAQPIMSLYGFSLGFTSATVRQERNPHDYLKDFVSEIPMYQFGQQALEIVENSIDQSETLEHNLIRAYAALTMHGITTGREMQTLAAWVEDLSRARSKDGM